jgi:hypothetical protein
VQEFLSATLVVRANFTSSFFSFMHRYSLGSFVPQMASTARLFCLFSASFLALCAHFFLSRVALSVEALTGGPMNHQF